MTSEGRIAILFTDNDYNVRLVTATADFQSNAVEIVTSDRVAEQCYPYGVSYIQNGVIAIVYAESEGNTTYAIRTVVANEIKEDKYISIQFKESISILLPSKASYIDLDSWLRYSETNVHLILAYITDDESVGLVISNIVYNPDSNSLLQGTRILNKAGGTSDVDTHGVHHLSILMLPNHRFLVSILYPVII